MTTKHASLIPAIGMLAVLLFEGCSPGQKRPIIPSRIVPPPLELSGQPLSNDSTVRARWLCRQEVPDPLAPVDAGPRVLVTATLYGRDVVRAEAISACDDTADSACISTWEKRYGEEHDSATRFRIRLDMRSSFSVNSLQARFWRLYVRTEGDLMFEPRRIAEREPVVVRRDSLPKPGRQKARPGLYTRTIDLYFDQAPLGVKTLGKDTRQVCLVMARDRREVARFTWDISSDADASGQRRRRASRAGNGPDF